MSLKKALEHILSNWVRATKEPFPSHPLAIYFREDFHNLIKDKVKGFEPAWITKASVGSGNWANVPWLSILNPEITNTTQDGIYPVYLFCADGSGVYLSLGQGITNLINNYGSVKAEEKIKNNISFFRSKIPTLQSWSSDPLNLHATTTLGRSYESTNIGSKFYAADSIPDDSTLFNDLNEMLSIYKEVSELYPNSQTSVTEIESRNNINSLQLPKPFILLAGISGTGKTRFIREQAQMSGSLNATYKLIAVRPDWHEPSDLLGYTSRLSGSATYVATDVLQFLVSAWQILSREGFTLDGDKDISYLKGSSEELDLIPPYWLCLDEMNLAPVEQYFANYLSIQETCEWHWEGEEFNYQSDALLSSRNLSSLDIKAQKILATELGLDVNFDNDSSGTDIDNALWTHFLEHGIAIPPNLIVAGTVNMDETTHSFSRKVLDRSLSFDFGEFFPNDFSQYYSDKVTHVPLTFPRYSNAKSTISETSATPSIKFLETINEVLKSTPFELAYRALNELLLAVHCYEPDSEEKLQAVWDDFMMQKVLPRIEGDMDKLRSTTNSNHLLVQSGMTRSLLDQLIETLEKQFDKIWITNEEPDLTRPDFYRLEAENDIRIACRSQNKLKMMKLRLDTSGFTSFWP